MRSIKRVHAPLAGAIALALVACGSTSPTGGTAETASEPSGTSTAEARSQASTSPASTSQATTSRSAVSRSTKAAIRAVRTAARSVRNGIPYDIERDRRRGRRVWEVKVVAGSERPHELDVSADGRRVVHRSRDGRSDDAARALRAEVALTRALRIADRRVAGRLSEAEIDTHRGAITWEATFEQSGDREHEVIVDARTGEVMRVTTEHDD